MQETLKDAKKIVKSVRGSRKSSVAATRKRSDSAKNAAPKKVAAKKAPASKKIRKTKTMAAVVAEGKKLTKNLKKRR